MHHFFIVMFSSCKKLILSDKEGKNFQSDPSISIKKRNLHHECCVEGCSTEEVHETGDQRTNVQVEKMFNQYNFTSFPYHFYQDDNSSRVLSANRINISNSAVIVKLFILYFFQWIKANC
jgi:hypothetical protein